MRSTPRQQVSNKGRRIRLSLPRRFIGDLLWASRRSVITVMERRMDVSPLMVARKAARPCPGWCAIFTRAYALVCAQRPEMRRAYIRWPWPHLYEFTESVAAIAIERCVDNEDAVLFTHVREPEYRSLREIEACIAKAKTAPITEIGSYRRILSLSRFPRAIRRLVWALTMNWPRQRARNIGTFGVSVTAGMGAATLILPSPLTTTLHYGVIGSDGSIPVRISFDHRVIDGAPVCRALEHLEHVLHHDVASELREDKALTRPLAI